MLTCHDEQEWMTPSFDLKVCNGIFEFNCLGFVLLIKKKNKQKMGSSIWCPCTDALCVCLGTGTLQCVMKEMYVQAHRWFGLWDVMTGSHSWPPTKYIFVVRILAEKLRCPKYHAAHADLIQQRESDHSCAFARAPKCPSALFSSLIYIKAQFGQKGGRTVYLRRAPRQINFFPSCIAFYHTNLKNIDFTEAPCTFHGFSGFSTKKHKQISSKLYLECT